MGRFIIVVFAAALNIDVRWRHQPLLSPKISTHSSQRKSLHSTQCATSTMFRCEPRLHHVALSFLESDLIEMPLFKTENSFRCIFCGQFKGQLVLVSNPWKTLSTGYSVHWGGNPELFIRKYLFFGCFNLITCKDSAVEHKGDHLVAEIAGALTKTVPLLDSGHIF